MRSRLQGIWPHPDVIGSWAYLVTEVAEVGDVLLRMLRPGDKRSHESLEDLQLQLRKELGDVMMMLATLANLFDIDLEEVCAERCENKIKKYLN
ncbi:MAG: MazG nucleotide pyrophosphohydrolase domain-containing protein [Acholeplasmataceae bacterium]